MIVVTSHHTPSIRLLHIFFLLSPSLATAAIEDYWRHQSDKEESSRMYTVYDSTKKDMVDVPSSDLIVGHIIQVKEGQPLPADLLMVSSSNERGHCFVETSSLDGETDLKPKVAVSLTHEQFRDTPSLDHFRGALSWESPNKKLESFLAFLTLPGLKDPIPLLGENLLLRGTVLKNTEWVFGVVAYTGEDTKIRCNVKQKKKLLKSTIFRMVDKCILGMMAVQFILCFIGGILAGVSHNQNEDKSWYLQLDASAGLEGFKRFFTWFIILSQLVPISLLVSSEIVKVFQAFFINQDLNIFDLQSGIPTTVRSSVINEDLGQVEFIFSDKTGTLTQNRMEFKTALIGEQPFGSGETEISKRVAARMRILEEHKRTGEIVAIDRKPWTELVADLEKAREASETDSVVMFDAKEEYLDALHLNKWVDPSKQTLNLDGTNSENAATHPNDSKDESSSGLSPMRRSMDEFLLHMALSNTITPVWDDKTNSFVFQASSPDELALCKFAQFMGYELVARNPTVVRVNKFGRGEDVELKFRHLATLGFNSKRKRVSILYERDGLVHFMCKGADSNILPLLPEADQDNQTVKNALIDMAVKGLRTLYVAGSVLDMSWWEKWKDTYDEVASLPERGEENGHSKGNCSESCRICDGLDRIEQSANLQYLGATAIEDRLQELVPEAIEDFLGAGVKVWMLTGDKRETAKNIGLACNLIDPDMENREDVRETRLVEVTGQWCKTLDNLDELRALFRLFDMDRNGLVDEKELQNYLSALDVPFLEDLGEGGVTNLFSLADKNEDGQIDFDEFVDMMRSTNISMVEAVESDIAAGLEALAHVDTSIHPISMVVEGDAFAALYPEGEQTLDEPSKKKKKKKKDKKQGKLKWRRRSDNQAWASTKMVRSPLDRTPEQLKLLRDRFFFLATMCKSVICCRLTPFQKAKIVQEVKKRQGVTTLAIGDGANDEAMIVEADVGIGIAGLEGSAAARASSYSIAQFRFLHTLLFVHGHWSYRRIAKLVPYIFYKTTMVVIVMYYFGFFSEFSGHQFFNDLIYLFYNVAFTAVPIMVLAVFDRALGRESCENNPVAYGSILRGAYFNERVFIEWVVTAFMHALIVFFVPYGALENSVSTGDGKTTGMWFFSTIIYICVVVVASLLLCLEFVTWTSIHHFFVWLSLFGFFFVIWLIGLLENYNQDMFGVIEFIFRSRTAWWAILITVSIPLLASFGVKAFKREFQPTLVDVLQERERMSSSEVKALPKLRLRPPAPSRTGSLAELEMMSPSCVKVRVDSDETKEDNGRHPRIQVHRTSSVVAIERSNIIHNRMDVVMSHLVRAHNLTGSGIVQSSFSQLKTDT